MKKLLPLLGCVLSLSATAQIDSTQLMKDVQTLSANKMEGRKTGTKGNRMAQFYILDRFKAIGLEQFFNTYTQSFFFNTGREQRIMGTNLYGYIKGKTDSFIVISAHYDHIGVRKSPNSEDSIYNGADDNASGVAGLLAMAKYFEAHPPKHNLIFAAFDAEEMGLRGSKDFVARLPVPATRILMDLNMDMISHNDKELYVCGTYHYPQLTPLVKAAAAKSKVALLMGHDKPAPAHDDWTGQSDQGPFHQMKIPFLYFGVEDHPDYHKASDEFSRINPSFFYQAVISILDVVKEADR